MALCPPCSDLWQRWLDTKPSTHVTPGTGFQSHAAYDDTTAGMRDNNRARHTRWVDLVRTQQAAIAQKCRTQHLLVDVQADHALAAGGTP